MKRNKLLDFLLWVVLIANIAGFLYYTISLFSDECVPPGQNGVSAVSSLVAILAVILLKRWNRFGYYFLCVAFVINGCISAISGSYFSVIGSVLGIVVWRLLLNLRSGDKSTWSLLKGGFDWEHCRHLYQCFAIASAIILVPSVILSYNKKSAVTEEHPTKEVEEVADAEQESTVSGNKSDNDNTGCNTDVLKVKEILNMSIPELISDVSRGKANPVELYALSVKLNGKNLTSESWAKQYWLSTLAPKFSAKYLSGDKSFASQKFVYLLSCQAKEDFDKYKYDEADYFRSLLNKHLEKFK